MNKFLTFQGKQPLYLGDIDFASDAIRATFAQLLCGLLGTDSPNAILYGIEPFQIDQLIKFSAGVVCIDGEILPVEESTAGTAGSITGPFYFRIKSTYGGGRTFEDGGQHDCWETRTVEVTTDETAYPTADFPRFQGGFGPRNFMWREGSTVFNLVKNGLVWLTTLRRPAMTQIEEHLFTMDITGIPPEDLNKFPTAATMVATTAYIEGNDGVTAEPMTVTYYRSNGVLHLVMDLVSGTAEAPVQMQVVLPVF
ncbi:MAG: hypothetical protein IKC14_02305 [Kiritimatiellae bacterium]|nr:hypothetical protein [Kiritimatiellia bacterium]